ncbi:unnamed protein product [Ectocarpus fasciculatus]
MVSTGIIVAVLRIVCMCLTIAYGLVSLSHITATWILRKDFYFAVRSPLLATTSGLVGEFVAVWAVSRTVLFPGPYSLLVLQIVNIPLTVLCFVGVYIVRGLRVLIMYTPSRRQRWGRYLMKEAAAVKTLLAAYAVVEVAAWVAVQRVGLARVGSFMIILAIIESLITLGASLVLFGKLRRTNDVFEVSMEIQKVGACALLTTVMISMLGFIPAWVLDVYMILFYTVRFHVVVWITNIEPAREILRRYSVAPRNGRIMAILFPFVPSLRRGFSTVAVDTTENNVSHLLNSIKTSVKYTETLEQILLAPPLLHAFEEYCLRALCGESILFLKAAWAFKTSVRASTANEDVNFALFMNIFDTYIKDGSPFEVNINSKTKSFIMKRTNMEAFKQLPLDVVAVCLDGAAQEVGVMLKEKLYDRFRETDQFKQITAKLALEAPGDVETESYGNGVTVDDRHPS